jgi:hypothetical protein
MPKKSTGARYAEEFKVEAVQLARSYPERSIRQLAYELMLSNFPVWLLDAKEPLWSTFGLKLVEKDPRAPWSALHPFRRSPTAGSFGV